jgi:hypothetical protein
MDRANKLICPNCGQALKSGRGVRIGRTIKCLHCAAAFTVRPEDAERTALVHGARLGVVLLAALVYSLGGAALAYYCFTLNAEKQITQVEKPPAHDEAAPADDAAPPPPFPSAASPPRVPVAQQRKIDDAIVNGVWYLRDHPWGDDPPDLSGYGLSISMAALPALTLLECGVPASDPLVQKAAALVRTKARQAVTDRDTYQLALAILFLDRLGDKKDAELIQLLALRLVAGQRLADGGWDYTCPQFDKPAIKTLLQQLRDGKKTLEQWRQTALNGKPFDMGRSDNSNTQFAVLALWVASRHNVAIAKPIALVEKRFRDSQKTEGTGAAATGVDGSWVYCQPDDNGASFGWPSMTCSGLLGMAVAHGVKQKAGDKKKALDDPVVQRGLAMLGRAIDQPNDARPLDLYFLWSMERVAVLYNVEKIGNKDWYAWGSKDLLAAQAADGSWKENQLTGGSPVVASCFALLFLKRANLAQDLTDKLDLLRKTE